MTFSKKVKFHQKTRSFWGKRRCKSWI